jgi:hypothetical protein
MSLSSPEPTVNLTENISPVRSTGRAYDISIPQAELSMTQVTGAETDLMKNFAIHAVCEWIGNTPSNAIKHYFQTLDRDFDKAVNGCAKSGAVTIRQQTTGNDKFAAKA